MYLIWSILFRRKLGFQGVVDLLLLLNLFLFSDVGLIQQILKLNIKRFMHHYLLFHSMHSFIIFLCASTDNLPRYAL